MKNAEKIIISNKVAALWDSAMEEIALFHINALTDSLVPPSNPSPRTSWISGDRTLIEVLEKQAIYEHAVRVADSMLPVRPFRRVRDIWFFNGNFETNHPAAHLAASPGVERMIHFVDLRGIILDQPPTEEERKGLVPVLFNRGRLRFEFEGNQIIPRGKVRFARIYVENNRPFVEAVPILAL